MQAQSSGRSAWFNATLDGRVLAEGGKWLIPIDLQQWPKALPSRGSLEVDVLQLPVHKAPWMASGEICIHSTVSHPALAAVGPQPGKVPLSHPVALDGTGVEGRSQQMGMQSEAKDAASEIVTSTDALEAGTATAETQSADADDSVMHEAASAALQPTLPLA